MYIPLFTNKKQTKVYIKKLKKWFDSLKDPRDENEILMRLHSFPSNVVGHIILILDPTQLYYIFSYGMDTLHTRRYLGESRYEELKYHRAKIVGYHILEAHLGNGPTSPNKTPLEILPQLKPGKRKYTFYVEPSFPRYGNTYLFLPYPDYLGDLKNLLQYFSKKSKNLERILDNYFQNLKEK